MKESLHSNDDIEKEIIMRTDKFLRDRGIEINEEETEITISN